MWGHQTHSIGGGHQWCEANKKIALDDHKELLAAVCINGNRQPSLVLDDHREHPTCMYLCGEGKRLSGMGWEERP